MQVKEKGSDHQIGLSEGECWGKRRSMDASYQRIQQMYYDAFEIAIVDALSKLTLN